MVCYNPNYIWTRKYYPIEANKDEKTLKKYNKPKFNPDKIDTKVWHQMPVPCGHCEGCRIDKANDWATRITNEAEEWENRGIFVTLTYDNDHLPVTKNGLPTLRPKDMVDYKKRLRKFADKYEKPFKEWINPYNAKQERVIRTFECGEYGEKKGRPHYHQIIFNWEPSDLKFDRITEEGFALYTSKTMRKIWGHGHVIIGRISYESASYVARYTLKKNGLAATHREYYTSYEWEEEELRPKTKYRIVKGEVEPEFITMSIGIGRTYFEKNIDKIKKNKGIILKSKNGAKLKRVPRFYKKIWEAIDWVDYEKWKYEILKHHKEYEDKLLEKYNLPENWLREAKLGWITNQIKENRKARAELLKQRRRAE